MQASLRSSTWLGLFALAVVAVPSAASAQTVPADQASAFMGEWAIMIESEYGPLEMDLQVVEFEGNVSAMIGSAEMGGTQLVSNISKEGEKLILQYEAEAQGQLFAVKVDLEPDGENLAVGFDAADGMFYATGTATKAD